MAKTSTKAGVAGVDVGKEWLDVAVLGGTSLRVANGPAGHEALIAFLRRERAARVGLEASGGYERAVVAALREAGFAVARLQPRQVKAYAVLRLRRAKTDALDAGIIAAATAALDEPRPAPDARLDAWGEHLAFIEQIEEDIARAKTRLEHLACERLRGLLGEEIARLKARRHEELKRLAASLRADADLARKLALVLSVPGIGERTAIALVVRLPELGTLSREEAAALVGVAPFNHDSGRHAGERHIAGGRARLRKSLFAAAQAAARQWNPALVAFYKRLRNQGKAHKAAIVACVRKLAIYANTVVERGTPWIPQTR
jgi:transposase